MNRNRRNKAHANFGWRMPQPDEAWLLTITPDLSRLIREFRHLARVFAEATPPATHCTSEDQ